MSEVKRADTKSTQKNFSMIEIKNHSMMFIFLSALAEKIHNTELYQTLVM